MAIRVNPKLIEELERYGAEDVQNCYHCGNCSAVCNHSDETFVFPRKPMRNLQMGLERRIRGSLDPWLCYYCGQCSTQCPRGAEPGETMMSLRRWLTAQYDVTGLSRLFYRSGLAEIIILVVVALLTGAGFLAYGLSNGNIRTYDGPTAFLPADTVHLFDWAMASVLVFFLGINTIRMWWFTTGGNDLVKPTLGSYLRSLYLLPLHFLTQKRYSRCDDKKPWLFHLALMLSYVTMLVLIMFFLRRMQAGPAIRWEVHAFGYAASLGLLVAVIYALRGRLKKSEPHLRHSHESDWIFLAMLLVVTLTGVTQHALHRAGLDLAANISYVVHLMFVVPMLVIEVPFSKWSHMIYRPVAMYLAEVHRAALARDRAVANSKAEPLKRAA